ncbi:hypothetical protein RW25_12420 [Bacillus sp. L_1B0_8]|uniref:thiol-disulfide oxidoreductase ResA n=1 Tax=unclassified Bacillus (in: firmicutes) TaxID=185979 RepID=UPI0005B6C9AD|nr:MULTISPECIES: thiol-disulfide oxidoreductase ResA [unclassified Bacillus (in: firmicutes)]KIQ85255.1 hypothetical protein RT27_19950 [Bacillus sp. L_1B0_5]KIQ88835.1 hypothetical protein RW25_12420 [Bacillus sp. L_1B0_8]
MRNERRFITRMLILITLFAAVTYAVYEGVVKKEDKNNIAENELAPDFILNTINKEKIQLSKMKKDGIIINFWGTWCEPCQREMSAFQNIYKVYKEKDIEIISINSQESEIAVKNFIKEKNLSFPVVIDTNGQIGNKYQVTTLPATYLIDSRGKIIKKHAGEMNENMLEQWIKQITNL